MNYIDNESYRLCTKWITDLLEDGFEPGPTGHYAAAEPLAPQLFKSFRGATHLPEHRQSVDEEPDVGDADLVR